MSKDVTTSLWDSFPISRIFIRILNTGYQGDNGDENDDDEWPQAKFANSVFMIGDGGGDCRR